MRGGEIRDVERSVQRKSCLYTVVTVVATVAAVAK
jgi:hypothetical protein